MHAPDPNIALAYVRAGFSIIPLAHGKKIPWAALLPEGSWASYQRTRPTQDDVLRWIRMADQPPNWGVICGQVSGGVVCGDCDDLQHSEWILEHANDPLFKGACIVRTGSGKAHIWFRSDTPMQTGLWRPDARGRKIGDIRADGREDRGPSYAAVPPSTHPDTGLPYQRVAGSFLKLPLIENGSAFLQGIALRSLTEHPEQAPTPMASTNRDILRVSDEDVARIVSHIKSLKLKKRIEDTLLRDGYQKPGGQHWLKATSHSEIDFAVVCELLRKGQTFDQIEEIFAATYIGGSCYRLVSRGNHGYAYLLNTFTNATSELELEKKQTLEAKGHNFEVAHVQRMIFDKDRSLYRLQVVYTRADGTTGHQGQVELETDDLYSVERTTRAFMRQIGFVPLFLNSQQGRQFAGTFGQAVMDATAETVGALEAHSYFGRLASAIRRQVRTVPEGAPADLGQAHSLGWHIGGEYFLRAMSVSTMLKGYEHTFKAEDTRRVLDLLDPNWEPMQWPWSNGETEEIVRLVLRRGQPA